MTKADTAVRALREAADALDALPATLRRFSLLGGPIVVAEQLRNEAAHIETIVAALQEATS